MDIVDPVYGEFSIRESVIQELILSKPIQRLIKINQAGALRYVDLVKFRNTRFEHSLGVYYLLRKFGATQEEQIAGLLHDVAHTAFSHVVDYIFEGGSQTQEYHEDWARQIVMQSEIPAILDSHGIDFELVIDEKRFSMLERPIPDICADRLDYFFRDAVVYGISDSIRGDVGLFMSALQVNKGEFVFSNIEIAKRAALTFIECGKEYWSNPLQTASFQLLADVMKTALSRGEIETKDFFLTDDELYEKLKKSFSPTVLKNLKMLQGLKAEDAAGGSGMIGYAKVRYIDPKVMQNGKIKRLSEYDRSYRHAMEAYAALVKRGFNIRIRSNETPESL